MKSKTPRGNMRQSKESWDEDSFFKIIKTYADTYALLSCSGATSSGELKGLHSGHAYSILACVEKNKFRLVQIRNPWGKGEWTGDWSDKSPLWKKNPAVAKACSYVDANDGKFWMTYEDFCAHFNWVGVCDRSLTLDSVAVGVRGEGTSCGPALGCLRLLDGISFWLVTQNS